MRTRVRHSVVLLIALCGMVFAGDRSNIRGIGMARSISGLARGIGALGINPANLGLPENRTVTLNMLPFAFRINSELLSFQTYKDYFTGEPGTKDPKFLTDQDKQNILKIFPGGVAATNFDFEIMPAGLSVYEESVGGFAVGMLEHVGGRLVIPRDYVRMFLYGLDSAGSRYVFDEMDISAWWWREYNFSYGRRIPVSLRNDIELFAGFGIKYVSGFAMMETARYKASIANERESGNQYRVQMFFDYLMRRSTADMLQTNNNASFSPFPVPAGTGMGFDIGFAARIRGLDIHLSVTDIGSISWKKNVVETGASYNLDFTDPFFKANEDTIQNAFRGRNSPGEAFSTSLPTRVRLGFVIGADTARAFSWMPRGLIVELDLSQGFNESMGNTGDLRASLGIEYRFVENVPLRTGISLGDDSKLRWAVGFGFDSRHFAVDLATENLGLLLSLNNFDMYSFALGFKIKV